MRNSLLILFIFCISTHVICGNIVVQEEIEWYENSNLKVDELTSKTFIAFENVRYDEQKDYLGTYSKQINLKQEKIIGLNIIDVQYETINKNAIKVIKGFDFIKGDIELSYINTTCKKTNYGEILFTPIIYNAQTATYQRVTKYTIEVLTQKSKSHAPINKAFTTNSVLETGEWYKIAVLQEGIFKISYSFLKSMGLDIDNLNPNNFRLYGNGGKMLPELNSVPRADDIQQNPVYIEGALDASFDENDYVLFYGQSSHNWKYNTLTSLFEHEMNKYSDTTFYFITFSNTGEPAKRIGTQGSLSSPTQTVTTFNHFAYYEKDQVNLIKSGSQWFGESFVVKTDYDFIFDFPSIDITSPVMINFSGAGRADVASTFTVSAGGSSINVPINSVNTTSYTSRYANAGRGTLSMTPSNSKITVNVSYSKPNSSSIGWLDEIEINARRNLTMSGSKLFFRDVQSVGIGNVSAFRLSNASSSTKIWEITDPLNIKEQQYNLTGNTLSFALSTDSLRSFAAFSSTNSTPIPLGSIENQNLHGINQADMIIISHPDFLNQADQLSNFHTDEGLTVITLTPQQIYNEFSSGSQDIVAIRDFIRMLYERNPAISIPKYLLLFGDGSYDNKNRLIGNTNFIPSYQTPNSFDVIGSLVSDDYYGLLDPDEGTWVGTEYVDLAIGRLCTKDNVEADNVVRKILNYNVPSSMKNWRNKIVFIGDDEDGNIHMSQSNSIAAILEANEKSYNPDKIFIDAYKQESTSGGSRYPEVNKSLTEAVEKGSLIINYTGHGGEVGWATERILNVSQINAWDNTSNFPLFITATCEFSRWDDPSRTSAGELVLLNASGGIGLLTTVRTVYSSPNFTLNKSVFDVGFTKINNKMPTMGEVFMQVKNLHASSRNNRNFTLLGDPALRLAYPKYDIKTTKLNGVAVTAFDTIGALSKVTIEGEIQDVNGVKLSSFNGVITPVFFDRSKTITTLSNDGGSPFTFNEQTNKLFKGKASVKNGAFSFTFILPKDISYNFGQGKLSYYAENQDRDANGYYSDLYIGAISDSVEADTEGPNLDIFINDENFVFGGITDENPILLAKVEDVHGINIVGNGIGHDIVAVLDEKTKNSYILNDFYEADIDNYQKGVIRFPFSDLEEGRHTLRLKVWDVYNNSSESTIEFVVVKSNDITLERVYNYPNPFTTYTEFWFEHNQPSKQMFVQVQIFTISGKLVNTIEKTIFNEGFRSSSISWDGLDKYGDRIGRGIYIYRLKVRTENFSIAEKYEKLVILK